MRIFGVTPAPIPTVITAVAVVTATGLGIWQIQRMFWKQDLIETRSRQSSLPVLEGAPASFDRAQHEYRRARVTGVFDHARELFVAARSLNGNVGYHVVTPLRLSGGRTLLVNRGWVPTALREPNLRAAGQVTGQVTLTGFMRAPQEGGWATRDNKPAANLWYTVDPAAMAKAANLTQVQPWYLEAGPRANPGGFPIGGQTRLELRNQHLQYVITWFSVALTGLVIWYLWHRRRERTVYPRHNEGAAGGGSGGEGGDA